jgi:hypothetical protein
MTTLALLLFTIFIRQALNSPINEKGSTHNLKPLNIPQKVIAHNGNHIHPILVPVQQHGPLLNTKTNLRKKKGPSIPVALPITHQLLIPTQLHVIPIHSNIHHSSIHTGIEHVIANDNVKLPIISHTIPHSTNVTHSAPLISILFPIHQTHLVPLHDLTVIPLHTGIHKVETKLSQFRATMEKKDKEDEEPINQYRSFYGGYGTGLYFGGHGAGHGFYAYG